MLINTMIQWEVIFDETNNETNFSDYLFDA